MIIHKAKRVATLLWSSIRCKKRLVKQSSLIVGLLHHKRTLSNKRCKRKAIRQWFGNVQNEVEREKKAHLNSPSIPDSLQQEYLFWLNFCNDMSFIQPPYRTPKQTDTWEEITVANTCNVFDWSSRTQQSAQKQVSVDGYGLRLDRTEDWSQVRSMQSDHSSLRMPGIQPPFVNAHLGTTVAGRLDPEGSVIRETNVALDDPVTTIRRTQHDSNAFYAQSRYPVVSNTQRIEEKTNTWTVSESNMLRPESPACEPVTVVQPCVEQVHHVKKDITGLCGTGNSHTFQITHTITLNCTKSAGVCECCGCCRPGVAEYLPGFTEDHRHHEQETTRKQGWSNEVKSLEDASFTTHAGRERLSPVRQPVHANKTVNEVRRQEKNTFHRLTDDNLGDSTQMRSSRLDDLEEHSVDLYQDKPKGFRACVLRKGKYPAVKDDERIPLPSEESRISSEQTTEDNVTCCGKNRIRQDKPNGKNRDESFDGEYSNYDSKRTPQLVNYEEWYTHSDRAMSEGHEPHKADLGKPDDSVSWLARKEGDVSEMDDAERPCYFCFRRRKGTRVSAPNESSLTAPVRQEMHSPVRSLPSPAVPSQHTALVSLDADRLTQASKQEDSVVVGYKPVSSGYYYPRRPGLDPCPCRCRCTCGPKLEVDAIRLARCDRVAEQSKVHTAKVVQICDPLKFETTQTADLETVTANYVIRQPNPVVSVPLVAAEQQSVMQIPMVDPVCTVSCLESPVELRPLDEPFNIIQQPDPCAIVLQDSYRLPTLVEAGRRCNCCGTMPRATAGCCCVCLCQRTCALQCPGLRTACLSFPGDPCATSCHLYCGSYRSYPQRWRCPLGGRY